MAEREPIRWRSRCANGACVEMAEVDGDVCVRDSVDPDGPWLRFEPVRWRSFVAVVDALRRPV
jgi:hypothetical protein